MQVTHLANGHSCNDCIDFIFRLRRDGEFLKEDAATMMKLELDPNTSSKDSAAEECEGAAKGSSDAGGKVGTDFNI